MTALIALFARDLRRAWGSGALWLPVVFFLLVATAFPFAVGPDAPLLARTGGGMVWVAALLAALLPIDRLIRPDREAGVLDQLAVRGFSDELIAAIKIAAHAIGFGLRSEEHTSELQSLMRISYAVFCLKKKNITKRTTTTP